MSHTDQLRVNLCRTYLLFQQASNETPVGPIAAATENLADALRSFGYLPSEAARVLAETKQDSEG